MISLASLDQNADFLISQRELETGKAEKLMHLFRKRAVVLVSNMMLVGALVCEDFVSRNIELTGFARSLPLVHDPRPTPIVPSFHCSIAPDVHRMHQRLHVSSESVSGPFWKL
jgi:hypothetical protein